MAIYHLSMRPVRRGEGRSSTAAAAYRAAEQIRDFATDQVFDYRRRRGVEHTEIVLPTAAAKRDINWARDRATLWNAAEQAEKRKDARVGREWEVALPAELDRAQRLTLVRKFAEHLANRYGCAVDVAVHRPHRNGDARNHHAHLLATTRTIEADGFGRKTDIELGDRDRAKKGLSQGADELTAMRERWATLTNQYLAEYGHEARIDHRSLKDQGIERQPSTHLGPAVSELERRGFRTRVGERIRAERAVGAEQTRRNLAELQSLANEEREVRSEIILLSTDLRAALAEREVLRKLELEAKPETLEERRARAIEEWKAYRERVLHEAPSKEERREPTLEQDRSRDRSRGGADDDFGL